MKVFSKSLCLRFFWSGDVFLLHWSNVSKVTNLKDRSLKVLSECLCLFCWSGHVFSSLWANISKVTSVFQNQKRSRLVKYELGKKSQICVTRITSSASAFSAAPLFFSARKYLSFIKIMIPEFLDNNNFFSMKRHHVPYNSKHYGVPLWSCDT